MFSAKVACRPPSKNVQLIPLQSVSRTRSRDLCSSFLFVPTGIGKGPAMKTIKIACLLSVLIAFAALSKFTPNALMHNSPGVFGYTDIGTAYQVDTGAVLVFQVRKTDGSIISIFFNGVEYKSTTNRFSQIASGLGTPTT